jgi:hypothetical protein
MFTLSVSSLMSWQMLWPRLANSVSNEMFAIVGASFSQEVSMELYSLLAHKLIADAIQND